MAKRTLTYQEALHELTTIIQAIEQGQLELDAVTTQLERAKFLLNFCNEQVQSVRNDVNQILNDEQK